MSHNISQHFKTSTLLKFALPSIIMMLFMSLYSIIDGVFVSRFVGSQALSALNIVYPVISLLIGLGVMLATGGSALIGKTLGEGHAQKAREYFSLFLVTGFVIGILLAFLGNLLSEDLARLLGANDALIPYSIDYLRTSLLFAPASILQLLFQSYFITASRPKLGLLVTIGAGILNIILDYVFLVPLNLGVQGAALATGFGQLFAAIFGMVYFLVVRKSLYIVVPHFEPKILLKAATNGSSEMVSNLSSAIVTLLFNLIMMHLIGEDGVAAITIILYGQFLFNALYLGFSLGVAPIISYNYGSQNHLELQNIWYICKRFLWLSSSIIVILALFFSETIVSIFVSKTSSIYTLANEGFFIFSINYLFAGFNIFASSLFTALSNGILSALISFMRTFICLVIALLVLPYFLGVLGVWIAVPIAEFITFFIAIYIVKNQSSTYHLSSHHSMIKTTKKPMNG
ncbi:MATE family efflux transporter [Sporanaerobium hydrogeniformans]|uniref:MATE family efflux transporter n=1 Tax=Sporanaerobium hydrogeniformans TaxID=3072179 RepID=A0AC61D8Z5_9FIRM|nr:MATE family efflux transporter [Sporanaerobium hydrogeniformans]PHV69689.1 MATE family efflux transporter [Sporanaerobium hydrogeniformans]